jgi:hypothetical protein
MKKDRLKEFAIAASLVVATIGTCTTALAGQPEPTDMIAPPPNITALLFYNRYTTDSNFFTTTGDQVTGTHQVTDVPIMQLFHSFQVDGTTYAAQITAPYVAFLGNQHVGPIPLSANSGFVGPVFTAMAWPIANPAEDEYLNLTYTLTTPVGTYNNQYTTNPSSNNWVNDPEINFTHILFGKPSHRRLDFEVSADAFFNTNSSFNGGPVGAVTTHIQPEEQVRFYFPYYFYPKTDAYFGLGFTQNIGGKQTVTLQNVPKHVMDTGLRTDHSYIDVLAGSFISPTIFVNLRFEHDVRVRGGFSGNTFEFRVGKIF